MLGVNEIMVTTAVNTLTMMPDLRVSMEVRADAMADEVGTHTETT